MKRTDFKNIIKRKLGFPMVKVELCDDQLMDNINYARKKFIKWAIGRGTEIVYFTIPLISGNNFYDLPKDVIDIISYSDKGRMGGINTLFTVENYFFNQGYFDPMLAYPYSMLGYHMVLDFMETFQKYNPSKYSYIYHKKTNQLELIPTPTNDNLNNISINKLDPVTNTIKTYTINSPGYVLLQANVIEGTTINNVIRDWDDVMKEIKPVSEHRIITSDEASLPYFILNNDSFEENFDLYKNGNLYTYWEWFESSRRVIKWTNMNEILLNDDIICNYNTVNVSPSGDNGSFLKSTDTITENYTINAMNILSKSFLLLNKTSDNAGVKIIVNNMDYVYKTGFDIDIDNQTILFNSPFTLNNILVAGTEITIIYKNDENKIEEYDESLYNELWIQDYATALSKISLGMVRRKFANFQSIGNTGISLDGDALVSEGKDEITKLEEELRLEETTEGGYICIG